MTSDLLASIGSFQPYILCAHTLDSFLIETLFTTRPSKSLSFSLRFVNLIICLFWLEAWTHFGSFSSIFPYQRCVFWCFFFSFNYQLFSNNTARQNVRFHFMSSWVVVFVFFFYLEKLKWRARDRDWKIYNKIIICTLVEQPHCVCYTILWTKCVFVSHYFDVHPSHCALKMLQN